METYLTRPVWTFGVDWGNDPGVKFSYDLKRTGLGFALPRYEAVQNQTVVGYEFEILLGDKTAMAEWLEFWAACQGRLNGFWVPGMDTVFEIVEGVDAAHFIIRDQGLRDTITEESCLHLVFRKSGETDQYAQINTVTDNGDGRELVGLTSSLDPAVDGTCQAYALRYMRFAEETHEASVITTELQRVKARVIELPEEYTAVETGLQPVFLYHFSMMADVARNWYLTSLNVNVVSDGTTYVSSPIKHGARSVGLKRESSLMLEGWCEPGSPMALIYPRRLPRPLRVKVWETTYATPNTRTCIFDGFVTEPELEGQKVNVKCVTLVELLGQKCPRFFVMGQCNYSLYSASCGVLMAAYAINGTIATSDPAGKNVLEITTASEVERNWLAEGWIECGTGSSWEIERIIQNKAKASGKVGIQLARGLENVAQNGAVVMYPWCDGTRDNCKDKFDNWANWGGHVIAPQNLSVKAMDSSLAEGVNKK